MFESVPGALKVTVMVLVGALTLTALVFAVFSKKWTTVQSLLWVLLIAFVPILGSILFFVMDHLLDQDRKPRSPQAQSDGPA